MGWQELGANYLIEHFTGSKKADVMGDVTEILGPWCFPLQIRWTGDRGGSFWVSYFTCAVQTASPITWNHHHEYCYDTQYLLSIYFLLNIISSMLCKSSSLLLKQFIKIGSFIFPTSEMRKLKPTNIKYLVQGHTASTRQDQVLNLGLSNSRNNILSHNRIKNREVFIRM